VLKGCILAIVALVGAYYAETIFLDPLHLPFAGALAPILALGVTLSITGIYGLPQSLRDWKREVADIATWSDGDMVQVIGRLKAIGQPLKAPASQRDALLYEYNITSENNKPDPGEGAPSSKLWGLDACDCMIVTENGSVRVTGFSPLQKFDASTFGGEAYLPQTAKFILGRKWRSRPKLSWDIIANPALIVGNENGEWEGDVATEEAEVKLLKGLPDKGERGEAQLLNRLRGGNWVVEERIVPPFARVKLRGRYKKESQTLDINLSIKDAVSVIEPAGVEERPKSEKIPAIVNLALILAATIAAHYAVYNESGKIYVDFIKWLRF
jgi:hypothetical protein